MDYPQKRQEIKAELANAGLSLCAFLALDGLLAAGIVEEKTFAGLLDHDSDQWSLVLIGNAGGALWDQVVDGGWLERGDPVDSYSLETAAGVFSRQLPDACWYLLYPQLPAAPEEAPRGADSTTAGRLWAPVGHLPLQRLGEAAGWHGNSPLGIGIHAKHGLWFAYRAALLVRLPLAEKLASEPMAESTTSPCQRCLDKPCLAACPAQALHEGALPEVLTCYRYRFAEQSRCRENCVARQACPQGERWRYPEPMTRHFYRASLNSAQSWLPANFLD